MHRFELGSFRCALLPSGQFETNASTLFGHPPAAELEAALARLGLVPGNVVMLVHPLFVDTGAHRVLLDPGTTEDYRILRGALRDIDVDAASIDTIVVSHGHADHWTAAVTDDGSPAFPNARFYLQTTEWTYWTTDDAADPTHAEPFRRLLPPLRDRFTLLEGDAEVVPGIEMLLLPGHTPGETAIRIGGRAVHCGDVLLSPINVERPEWIPTWEPCPEQVLDSRRRLLATIAAERLRLVTPHAPWPGVYRVETGGRALRWAAA